MHVKWNISTTGGYFQKSRKFGLIENSHGRAKILMTVHQKATEF